MKDIGILAAACIAVGCGEPNDRVGADAAPLGQAEQALHRAGFGVQFSDCAEYVGIGFVPAANARPLVPRKYELAGDGESAILVVRIVECEEVEVDGKKSSPTRLSQIGVTIEGGDASADINNYLLWFVSDSASLHRKLSALGVDNERDEVKFEFAPHRSSGGRLRVDVRPAHAPGYRAIGEAETPTAPPVPFVASWWAEARRDDVLMRTEFPEIQFGTAEVTLTTSAGSELAQLIGGRKLTFALLDSYNDFASASMQVTLEP